MDQTEHSNYFENMIIKKTLIRPKIISFE